MNIGFIGLGIMGKPMCKNLLHAGYNVIISSSNKKTNDELSKEGATVVETYRDLAEMSDIVFTIVPDSKEVEEVILSDFGIIHHLNKGSTVVDMSSISPATSKKVGKKLIESGFQFLDAPVSGGEPRAIDGTLSMMVGGEESTFNDCLPLLKVMADSVVLVGNVGSGNATKLANQIIVALNIAAVSEAFTLVKRLGVDLNLVTEAIQNGLAGSAVLDAKGPMMIERHFEPGFKVDLHLKDIKNALETAEDLQLNLPLTTSIFDALKSLTDNGFGKEDHAAIIKYFEQMNEQN